MSKLHYLLTVLILSAVAYVSVSQLWLAQDSARRLLGQEVSARIQLRLDAVYVKLGRFPDSDRQFPLMVLSELGLEKHLKMITIQRFVAGNSMNPARFQVRVSSGSGGADLIIPMEYYGSDYHADFRLKGRLRSTQ